MHGLQCIRLAKLRYVYILFIYSYIMIFRWMDGCLLLSCVCAVVYPHFLQDDLMHVTKL